VLDHSDRVAAAEAAAIPNSFTNIDAEPIAAAATRAWTDALGTAAAKPDPPAHELVFKADRTGGGDGVGVNRHEGDPDGGLALPLAADWMVLVVCSAAGGCSGSLPPAVRVCAIGA
jgi:hypothetical protein